MGIAQIHKAVTCWCHKETLSQPKGCSGRAGVIWEANYILSVSKLIFPLSPLYCGRETKPGNGTITPSSVTPKLFLRRPADKEKLAFTVLCWGCTTMAWLELGAAGPSWSPWKRKGAKAVKKAEAGTNEFPFRNCSSDCYI